RRLLHRLLAVKTAAGHGGLSDQIRQAVIASDLPPYLKQALQTLVRVAKLEPGSSKSEKPDTLTPAEPGEPEWLLDIVEAMFDLYFVRPAHMERKQAALEESIGCDADLQPAPPPEAAATATPAAPSAPGAAPMTGVTAPAQTTTTASAEAPAATTGENAAANPGAPTA
ncbi:MAG: hypothetical protein GX657_06820, partial [Chloroflexi bacterium]|nr:hypothetical protein [Chloroflexota bacterium]